MAVIIELEENKEDNSSNIINDQSVMETEDGQEAGGEEFESKLSSKGLIKILAQREVKLKELRSRIAGLATSVISHPEHNIKKLRELLLLFDIKSDDQEYGLIFFSIQKLVALSALQVFCDIIPGFRVREKFEEDDEIMNKRKNFRLKKETKKLREYEKVLVQMYRLYLSRLERMTQCIGKSKKSNFYSNMLANEKAREKVAIIGVKCLCELINRHPQFNFRTKIIELLVPLMSNKHGKLASMACNAITSLFKQDKSGEISLETVKEMSKFIKAKGYNVNPNVLRTFLHLKIKEVKKPELAKKDMGKVRDKLDKMSRKEKKRNKKMQKLENQLLETQAQESQERKLKNHTEILNKIFVTYFRILKYNLEADEEKLKFLREVLTPVLEGLSKFGRLISVEFFDELISILYRLIQSGTLDDHQSLHSLLTVFTILSGEGMALNIDPQRFYSQLYVILLNVDTKTSSDDIKVLLSCIEMMILKRKKQMSNRRVLAFIKRLSTISLQTSHESAIAILSCIRRMMLNHSQSDVLLDSECVLGSGLFMPELEDPEYCNANSTLLYELHHHSRHYHPLVRRFGSHLLSGCKGNQFTIEMTKKRPLELYEEMSCSEDQDITFPTFNTSILTSNVSKKTRYNTSFINEETSVTSNGYKMLSQMK